MQCNVCKSWKDCPGPLPFYPPAAVRFCHHQVRWILENAMDFDAGRWPAEPSSAAADQGKRTRAFGAASFETPACVHAEISQRLARCGPDGVMALRVLANGWDATTVGQLMGLRPDQVAHRIERVIFYCSGWRRRQVTYKEFNRRHAISEYQRRCAARQAAALAKEGPANVPQVISPKSSETSPLATNT